MDFETGVAANGSSDLQRRSVPDGMGTAALQDLFKSGPRRYGKTLVSYLGSVGMDLNQFDRQFGREKIYDALLFAKGLKDRYSVLWVDLMAG